MCCGSTTSEVTAVKREKLFSALWAFLLSFALSASAVMCIVTAFDMGIDTGFLLRTCFWAALISAICYCLPLGLIPPGIGAVLLGYLWQSGTLEKSVEAFLNRLTRQYDRAYSWGIIRWSYRVAEEMEPDILFCLCILGALIAMVCAWTVCRRRTVFPAMGLSLVTLATCFVVTDTVPDSPWLYLLLLCFAVLVMTGTVRRQEEKQGNRLCLYLTPVAALALLLLFAAIPQSGYSGQNTAKNMVDAILSTDSMQLLLGRVDDGNTDANGDTGTVDLKSVGYRVDTHAQVLQVTAPYTGTLYLRGRAMDLYDGVSWQQSGINYGALYWPGRELESIGELTVTTRFAHRMLYTPYYVTTSDSRDISTGILNEKALTEYSFSCRPSPTEAELSAYGATAADYSDYIQMEGTVRKWAIPLVTRTFPSDQSVYQTARAIASYVRNSARYDIRTPRMPSSQKNFAQWFLEESDTGYCVHFATAATVLLQAAGIPARFVTGYYAQVTEGETVTVYSDQSHAWAEYWLPGFGWTVLEATPPDFSGQQTQTEPTVSDSTIPQIAAPDETQPVKTPTPSVNEESKPSHWMLWSVAALCLLLLTAEGQYRLRRRLRQKRLDTAAPNEKALLYWQETTACANLLGEQPDKMLYRLAEMAKFSQYTLTDAQLQQFEIHLQTAQQKLRKHNFFRRLYYRFLKAIY